MPVSTTSFVLVSSTSKRGFLPACADVHQPNPQTSSVSTSIMPAPQLMPATSHLQQEGAAAASTVAAPAPELHPAQHLLLTNLPLSQNTTPPQGTDNAATSRTFVVSLHTNGNSVALELTPVTDGLLPDEAAPVLLNSVNCDYSVLVHGLPEQSAPHAAGPSDMQRGNSLSQKDDEHETANSQGPPLLDTQGPPHTQVHMSQIEP